MRVRLLAAHISTILLQNIRPCMGKIVVQRRSRIMVKAIDWILRLHVDRTARAYHRRCLQQLRQRDSMV